MDACRPQAAQTWLWLAVERHSRRIVAWVPGRGGFAQALPRTDTWYYTNEWEAYKGVLPKRAHQSCAKGSGQTSLVEAISCSLRQRCGVLVRKACFFSRSLAMRHVRIPLVVDEHTLRGATCWATAGAQIRFCREFYSALTVPLPISYLPFSSDDTVFGSHLRL